jgi:hypothetical protein
MTPSPSRPLPECVSGTFAARAKPRAGVTVGQSLSQNVSTPPWRCFQAAKVPQLVIGPRPETPATLVDSISDDLRYGCQR